MKISLCIIATGKYIDFVQPLIESARNFFLYCHDVRYHIFSNHQRGKLGYTFSYDDFIFHHHIEHQPWPLMTLNRYHIITSVDLSGYDYIYYIDADSLFVAPVGDEILNEMTVVSHPGYFINGGGSWEHKMESRAYVPKIFRKQYVCGGFNGGSKFLHYAEMMKQNIDKDSANGITAIWHDESHLNNVFAHYRYNFTLLPADYMMPESIEKRKAWGISHIEPKIIALEKDHKNYQK